MMNFRRDTTPEMDTVWWLLVVAVADTDRQATSAATRLRSTINNQQEHKDRSRSGVGGSEPWNIPQSKQPTARTMTKPNNNYAARHTPIASVKRPRSSLNGIMLSPGAAPKASGSGSAIIPSTPLNNGTLSSAACASTPSTIKEGFHEDDARDQLPMSPMHPDRPFVIREDVMLPLNR
jgi:hypothetical protein